jgi:hypothetical protein
MVPEMRSWDTDQGSFSNSQSRSQDVYDYAHQLLHAENPELAIQDLESRALELPHSKTQTTDNPSICYLKTVPELGFQISTGCTLKSEFKQLSF